MKRIAHESLRSEGRSTIRPILLSLRPSLNSLLIFVPAAIALEFMRPDDHSLIFAAACLAIVPLAGVLGHATEQLAEHTSETLGGLLNATFGNAAELIIGLMAIHKGVYDVAKASLTGSIIGNLLLVLGGCMLAGGARFKQQRFNTLAARSRSTTLILAVIGFLAPAVFHAIATGPTAWHQNGLSFGISGILITTYGLSLLFSLHTHRELVSETPDGADLAVQHEHTPEWTLRKSIGMLAGATALIAWISEILVGSVEATARDLGMSDIFVGVVIVATVGNAAEHSTAVVSAWKNRMDLAIEIAVGSSIQIALLVTPLLVFASTFLGPKPMDLVFSIPELVAVAVTVAITQQIAGDGESNWLEGAQLLAVYLIVALMFFFLT